MDHHMSSRICLFIFEIHHLLDNFYLRLRAMPPPVPVSSVPIFDVPRVRSMMTMTTVYMILMLMMARAT